MPDNGLCPAVDIPVMPDRRPRCPTDAPACCPACCRDARDSTSRADMASAAAAPWTSSCSATSSGYSHVLQLVMCHHGPWTMDHGQQARGRNRKEGETHETRGVNTRKNATTTTTTTMSTTTSTHTPHPTAPRGGGPNGEGRRGQLPCRNKRHDSACEGCPPGRNTAPKNCNRRAHRSDGHHTPAPRQGRPPTPTAIAT